MADAFRSNAVASCIAKRTAAFRTCSSTLAILIPLTLRVIGSAHCSTVCLSVTYWWPETFAHCCRRRSETTVFNVPRHRAEQLSGLQRPGDLVSTEDDAGRHCFRADELE